MYQEIPENKYKREKIGDHIAVTGYKSLAYDFSDGFNSGKVDPEHASLSIKTDTWTGGQFEFNLMGRKSLLQLREVIDFALEVEENATD